ncbi:MAG: ATP-binding protein [Lachnospiraceae bacterium]|nr:ATP-binding protein [Lachnospiraceae bacterium]
MKKERFIQSSFNENEIFYTSSEWEMNKNARLYTMLRLMEATNSHCAYCVDIFPVDYCETLEKSLTYILPHLRELNSFKVKTSSTSVSSGGKDENAKKALDFYEDLMDNIIMSPHFLMNIQVLGETEALAKQILDAAASEALLTGTHTLYAERLNGTVFDATTNGFLYWSDLTSPQNLAYLPHLMTLEEMVPFAIFPVLFPGETIEMSKETVPPKQIGMMIGKDKENHEIYFPWNKLSKHAFLAGMPGSGKTNAMMYLASEMYKAGIPILILEPAKKEYRVLTTLEGMKEISLFSPCANSMFPLHINPFEFPKGMKLADHINRLLDVFNGAFQLDPPMPMLLAEGIQSCYEALLWLPGMINSGDLEYPTMRMLYTQIERLFDKYKYAGEVRSNLQSILQVRIGSLLAREMGDIFDVKHSTFLPEEWLQKSAVIELASLGTGPSNFLMLMLMTLIRENLDIQVYRPENCGGKPRHVIFLEEAHNLIANTSVQTAGNLDPKISATALITKMLAEVRALGQGIVIADQLPTAMAPEVVKNTSLKFGFRLTSQDERELLGATMSADGVQMERMGIFLPGCSLVSYEDLLKPFEMQIPEFKGDAFIDDEKLLESALCNPIYHYNMLQSAKIMKEKFEKKKEDLIAEQNQFFKKAQATHRYWKEHSDEITTENKEILRQKREIEDSYQNLMEQWCRLTLDVFIYRGITAVRREKLAHSMVTEQEKRYTIKAHNEWFDIIVVLYREVQKERKLFKEFASKVHLKPLEELENNLLKQQKIIQSSWAISNR